MISQLVSARNPATQFVLIFGALIAAAEVAMRAVGPTVTVLIDAALLSAVATQLAFISGPKDPLIAALAMLPVIRLAGIALPIDGIPPVVRWALLTVPALIALVALFRQLRVTLDDLGLRPRPSPAWQHLSPVVGIPFGVLLRLVVGPDARLAVGTSELIIVAAALAGVVILEEVLFRGLLQHLLGRFGQTAAVLASSALYAAMYINAGPLLGAGVMALTGLAFSWLRWRTGTLYGVIGAHLVLRVIVEA